MNPQVRRFLVTFTLMLVMGVVVSVVFFSPNRQQTPPAPDPTVPAADTSGAAAEKDQDPGDPAQTQESSEGSDPDTIDQDEAEPTDADDAAAIPTSTTMTGLHATPSTRGAANLTDTTQTMGSLDPEHSKMLIEYSTTGAGMKTLTFSDIWLTAKAKRQALAHKKDVAKGVATPTSMPGDDLRYVLFSERPIHWKSQSGQDMTTNVPAMAAHSVIIDGKTINLANAQSWAQINPGEFESIIVDTDGTPVLTINRRFTLGDSYDITLEQTLTNHIDRALNVTWRQYGPGDLFVDRAKYIDRRRFRFGYLFNAQRDPARSTVMLTDDMLEERMSVQKRYTKAMRPDNTPQERDEYLTLWPNATSRSETYELSSFASTNRYFAFAVHPLLDARGVGPRTFSDIVEEIEFSSTNPDDRVEPAIFTYLYSPEKTIEPGSTIALNMGIYAGPLDPGVLEEDPRYSALRLEGLILYQMSSFCAICTFQWLAHALLWFLTLVDVITLDWGVSIILLVIVVRTLLHPITKRSQIKMRLFSDQMQKVKPEVDRLQKKYPNDPKKLQQEQMRFMREHNINPAGAAFGCLPMFLQMPIWVALYAMLYFVFDLRQEAAFYGIFQRFWDWPFLGDLSASDHFFGELATPTKFLLWNVTGINVLPLLMGVIFYLQQKYMTPPPSPTMTKEQLQQQKIMKIMMVVMFPLMLYSAPSGLTLYILTSSTVGIIESKYIRSHINEMDLKKAAGGSLDDPKSGKKSRKKPKNPQGRAFAEAVDRAKKKRKGPDKKFKKRK